MTGDTYGDAVAGVLLLAHTTLLLEERLGNDVDALNLSHMLLISEGDFIRPHGAQDVDPLVIHALLVGSADVIAQWAVLEFV